MPGDALDTTLYHPFDKGQLALALDAAQRAISGWPPNACTAGGLLAAVEHYVERVPRRNKPPLLQWLLSDDARNAALAA